MTTPILILVCILAYLLGSIPIGFLVAKKSGINIQDVGSGNIGATNVARTLGPKMGIIVGVLDFFKSFLPAVLAFQFLTQDWQMILVATMPVVGHIFPVWLNFKGGKGVATIFGILAGFFGPLKFLVFIVLWLLALRLINLMSLVNLIVGLLMPLGFWLNFRNINFTLFGAGLGLILWWTHRENIQRLLAGKENKLR